MQVTAQLRHLHMSPRKVRRIANLVKGMPVVRAQAELEARAEQAALPLQKLLKSAVANARTLTDAAPEHMLIASFQVNEGPSSKRFRPRSRGMAHQILRRTSHVSVILTVPEGAKRLRKEAASPPIPASTLKEDKKEVVTPEKGSAAPKRSEGSGTNSRLRPKFPKISKRFFQRKSV